MKRLLPLFAVVLISFARSDGQSFSYIFKHLTTSDGLVSNNIISLIQDAKGFVWIGTNNGLQRYDGHSFVTWHHNPADTTTLRTEDVRCFLEDSEGCLWLNNWPLGFSRFDTHTGRAPISSGIRKRPPCEVWICRFRPLPWRKWGCSGSLSADILARYGDANATPHLL